MNHRGRQILQLNFYPRRIRKFGKITLFSSQNPELKVQNKLKVLSEKDFLKFIKFYRVLMNAERPFLVTVDQSGKLNVRHEQNLASLFSAEIPTKLLGESLIGSQFCAKHRSLAILPHNKPFLLFSQINKPVSNFSLKFSKFLIFLDGLYI